MTNIKEKNNYPISSETPSTLIHPVVVLNQLQRKVHGMKRFKPANYDERFQFIKFPI